MTGIFCTTNNGTSWNLIALPDKGFGDTYVSDSILYSIVSIGAGSGIYFSLDIGKDWAPFYSNPGSGANYYRI